MLPFLDNQYYSRISQARIFIRQAAIALFSHAHMLVRSAAIALLSHAHMLTRSAAIARGTL